MNEIAQALALLASMRDNLPNTFDVNQKYVGQFHEILDTVESASGTNLGRLRVPATDLCPEQETIVTTYSQSARQKLFEIEHPVPQGVSRGVNPSEMVISRSDLILRIDAALRFLSTLEARAVDRQIGFQVSH